MIHIYLLLESVALYYGTEKNKTKSSALKFSSQKYILKLLKTFDIINCWEWKKVENRFCLTGVTSIGSGTISNWSAISGTTPLASAVIAVPEKARLYSRGLLLNKLSMNGSPCEKDEKISTHIHILSKLQQLIKWLINQYVKI